MSRLAPALVCQAAAAALECPEPCIAGVGKVGSLRVVDDKWGLLEGSQEGSAM